MGANDVNVEGHTFHAATLKTGDHVLMCTGGSLSSSEAQRLRDTLQERFPDVEFTFIEGITGVVVHKATD